MIKADAILCADLHIRETVPECRTDDFLSAQEEKHQFLQSLQIKHECPVLVAGDLFHKSRPPLHLIANCFDLLSYGIIAIPGQHDLPEHNLDRIDKSGINLLHIFGMIQILAPKYGMRAFTPKFNIYGFPWGINLRGLKDSGEKRRVALVHKLVFKGKEPFPGAANDGYTAKDLIKKMPGFDLIVTGDNHQTFTERVGKQLLVNPGSLMRTTAAQIDHKPCVFLWYADENEVEQVFLPIDPSAVSREHLEIEEERENRIASFTNRLRADIELSMSFKDNLKQYLAKNKIRKEVANIIWEAVDG